MSKITDEMRNAARTALLSFAGANPVSTDALADAVLAAVYPLIEKQVREECARELKPGWLRREIDAAERDEIVDAAFRRLREDIRKVMQETKP